MTFDRIMDAVSGGEATAGLIIHESRFTYPLYNLEKLLDLGEWWEKHSGLPIPLGGILGKRTLGKDALLGIENAIRESLRYARLHPDEVLDYCRQHSQEMDESVMKSHIGLYVNDFSLDLGEDGLTAVRRLFAEAEERGVMPPCDKPLLVED
jgi:1,4-dihydroxy-6-naphthoate synthase